MTVLLINGCTRENGNTEQLAKVLLDRIDYEEVILRNCEINHIQDLRHTSNGFPPLSGEFQQIVEKMLKSDSIIFATPVYWYGMSGLLKDYFDNWSHALRDNQYDFKTNLATKQFYAVVVGGDRARIKALPLIQQFEHIVSFTGNTLKGYVIGEGNAPGDIQNDSIAISMAKAYNKLIR